MNDVAVVLGPTTIAGVRDGRRWRRELASPRATCAGDGVVYVLDGAGVVWSHGESVVQEVWRLAAAPGAGPCAVSSDGAWVFDGDHLRSATAVVSPFDIDFWERWTFATFLPEGHLVLAWESGQPWAEYGSYGDRKGGVQVHARRDGWPLAAFEFDSRRHDADYVPVAVAWHPRGVLARLVEGELDLQVLTAPRGEVVPECVPTCDSSAVPVAFSAAAWGLGSRLVLDASGGWLLAPHADGVDVLDLERKRRAVAPVVAAAVAIEDATLVALTAELDREVFDLDGLAWEPLDTWR